MVVNNEQNQEPTLVKRKMIQEATKTENTRLPASGLDVGTGFLVSATSTDGKTIYKTQRDAFVDVENNVMSKNMLSKLKAPYIESEDKKLLYVIGNDALNLSSFFNRECRRPLSKGVLSSREKECLMMLKFIIHNLTGDPVVQNEKICFSVPANPIDDNFNGIYHENVLKSFLTSFGFDAIAVNEAFAIVLSELEEEDYTGLSLSFGSGMVNVALSFMGISDKKHQLSIARSGDWIDANAAIAIGSKASKITVVKEAGVDLLNPKNREENAIKIFYENLINYTCNALEKSFNNMEDVPNFPNPISIVLSGGTSKAINFDKLFEQEIKTKNLPFQIKAVKKASDPLNAVAKGCLLNALSM
jgi:actin-like ATPase involved in cell morphogenesis